MVADVKQQPGNKFVFHPSVIGSKIACSLAKLFLPPLLPPVPQAPTRQRTRRKLRTSKQAVISDLSPRTPSKDKRR